MNAKIKAVDLRQARVDAELELQIDAGYDAMLAAPDDAEALRMFHVMKDLIARRSPDQIKRMQRAKRLDLKRSREG